MKESIFGKNKDYMSYSAWKLWRTSKDQYRRRYYEGEKPFTTVETEFGNTVHAMLENGDVIMNHVKRYQVAEYPLEVNIGGNKIYGIIDSCDRANVRFLDYKTSHKSRDGKVPWDRVKVAKLDQLPFYSMMLREKFGRVYPYCHLIWIETEFENEERQFDGHTLTSQSRKLKLTGKIKQFSRRIYKKDRERIKKDLLLSCEEIKADYQLYLNK